MLKKTTGEKIFTVANGIILVLLSITCLFPFLHVAAKSFSSETAILAGNVLLWPEGFNVGAYSTMFRNSSMNNSMMFTITLTLVGTVTNIIMTLLAAYPLSKRSLIGNKTLWLLILFTMYFSGGMIPLYLVVSGLGMLNSIWALILPGAISTYNMIIMRTFFEGIPVSLEESAKLDGCTDMGVLFRIVLPLSMPVIATLSLFYAVAHWNSFQNALLYINDTGKYTLQLRLRQMVLQDNIATMMEGSGSALVPRESLKAAAIMYATLPILIVYPWLQRFFVKGVMIGSVKE